MKSLILDACVLIDYLKTDRLVLKLFAVYIAPVYVISPVIREINQIESSYELIELGLSIDEPELDDVFLASNEKGPNSFQDLLCLYTAKRNGYICVTNDKNLRRRCREEGVSILWGLELQIDLYRTNGISRKDAEKTAQMIRESNPKHITRKIIETFFEKIKQSST